MNKNTWIAVAISVFVVGYYLFGGTIVGMFSSSGSEVTTQTTMTTGTPGNNAEALVIQDEVIGTGEVATPGTIVSVHYTGTLENGQVFDSSIQRGTPIQFILGRGMVIAGWEQGIAGMKVGGKRKLIIPPSLGYGAHQVGPIPANSTLIFDVELVNVSKAQ